MLTFVASAESFRSCIFLDNDKKTSSQNRIIKYYYLNFSYTSSMFLLQTESIYHYEKGASLGERHSCFRLAELLVEGTIISRDPNRAIE